MSALGGGGRSLLHMVPHGSGRAEIHSTPTSFAQNIEPNCTLDGSVMTPCIPDSLFVRHSNQALFVYLLMSNITADRRKKYCCVCRIYSEDFTLTKTMTKNIYFQDNITDTDYDQAELVALNREFAIALGRQYM